MGHMGPLGEEGVPLLGLAPRGGAHPPLADAPPPWGFSPTWGRGGGWHPPLGLYK